MITYTAMMFKTEVKAVNQIPPVGMVAHLKRLEYKGIVVCWYIDSNAIKCYAFCIEPDRNIADFAALFGGVRQENEDEAYFELPHHRIKEVMPI